MLNNVSEMLNTNLSRVDNLVSLYDTSSRGSTAVKEADILRAALVMLHASLEDYLRALLIWKIDQFEEEILDEFEFNKKKKRSAEKISLGELSRHREKSVAEVIDESVRSQLEEYQSFNNLGDVKKALQWCGISKKEVEKHDFGKLHVMIERRHNIVHKADRNSVVGGQGNHRTKSISKSHVERYILSVRDLSSFVSSKLSQ